MTPTLPLLRVLALVACLLPACLESNPQPSPGGSGTEWEAPDAGTPDQVLDVASMDIPWGGGVEIPQDAATEISEGADAGDGVDAADGADPADGDDTPDAVDTTTPTDWGPTPEMCDLCEVPYPACTSINGQWVCVQCTDDSHCSGGGCACDTNTFTCMGNCGSPDCVEDADCLFEGGPEDLRCHGETGTCYDPDGTCDGVITQCLPGSSSECVDVFGAPVIPGTPLLNFCACEGPIPLDDAWACAPDWTCPENEACFPDQVCLEFDLLCMFLDGCPDPAYGGGICVGPEILEMTLFE